MTERKNTHPYADPETIRRLREFAEKLMNDPAFLASLREAEASQARGLSADDFRARYYPDTRQ